MALVAKHFGGGGHKQASGCKMEVPLSEAQEKVTAYVLAKIDAALEKKKNANAAKSRKKAEAAKTAPVAAAASKENA